MKQKGQILSYDLLLAGFLFLMIVVGTMMIYNTQKNNFYEQYSLEQMHLSAVNATNTILSDKNCLAGGLINEKPTLSAEKIACFNSADYNTLKQNLSIDEYEFNIKVFDANASYLNKGTTTNKRAVAIQRAGILNNSGVKIIFVLYEK